jgi:hypothetical protein
MAAAAPLRVMCVTSPYTCSTPLPAYLCRARFDERCSPHPAA